MSQDRDPGRNAILGTIRRGLKRGPLPADQQAMLAGRLATHPRHLVPARGQGDSASQVASFMENILREFGTVQRLPDFARRAGGDRHLSRGAEHRRRDRGVAASRTAGDPVHGQHRCSKCDSARPSRPTRSP